MKEPAEGRAKVDTIKNKGVVSDKPWTQSYCGDNGRRWKYKKATQIKKIMVCQADGQISSEKPCSTRGRKRSFVCKCEKDRK